MPTSMPDRVPCPQRRRAVPFAHGELEPAEHERYARHLDACLECRAEVDSAREATRALTRGLARWAREARGPAPDLPERTLARVSGPPSRRWRVPGPARAAAGLLVAGLGLAAGLIAARQVAGPDPSGAAGVAAVSSARGKAPGVSAAPVGRAAVWLLRAQEDDGSWDPGRWGGDPRYRVALTALASLALPSEGRAERGARRRAARWLSRAAGPDGSLGPAFRGATYNLAIGALALAELGGPRRTSAWAVPAERALGRLAGAQGSGGCWGYAAEHGVLASESIAYWALRALLRGRELGYAVPDGAVERGLRWLAAAGGEDRATAVPRPPPGRAGHVCGGAGSSVPTAALAATLRSEAGRGTARAARRAIDHLVRADGTREASASFYRSFLVLRALESVPAPRLEPLRRRVREDLAATQVRDGPLRGSWDPEDRWGPVGGRLYATALAALALRPGGA